MWGIVPAAGTGSRIQPLAFSKELLPVGSRTDGETERPKAVSEYLLERMILAGATKICMVISHGKSDIVEYYGGSLGPAHICYVVQPEPRGLCDALFRALPLLGPDDQVLIGLPDTVWFPEDGLGRLGRDALSFLLFPVQRPELFDAVVTNDDGRVLEIQVKRPDAASRWVWGAFRMPAGVFRELHGLWRERADGGERDVYVGTLINAWLARGGEAWGIRAGESYVDVGTLHGYHEAIQLLERREVLV
ncbi:MAG: nucleotidyltransferase family protein [Acidobacteria bacterium]|nr:nucleotidyltransferase family protein [Acidobacteriota bacterium]